MVAELATATYQQLESAMNSGLARRLGNEARLHKVYDNPIDTMTWWFGIPGMSDVTQTTETLPLADTGQCRYIRMT